MLSFCFDKFFNPPLRPDRLLQISEIWGFTPCFLCRISHSQSNGLCLTQRVRAACLLVFLVNKHSYGEVTLCVPNLGGRDSGNCMCQFLPNFSVFLLPLHLLSFILWELKSHVVIMRLKYTMLSRCLSWKATSANPGVMPDPNSSSHH